MFGLMPELSEDEYAAFLAWRDGAHGEPDGDETTVVVETPSTEELRVAAEAQAVVIEAQADAQVAVIEAQAAAETKVMEAAAELENGDDDDDPELFDSDGNARPESQHWFFRPLGGKR